MVTRRSVLKGLLALSAGNVGLAGYAFGVEPMRTVVTTYRLTPNGWPKTLGLKIAVLADIHACEPWMSAARIRSIVDQTNGMGPDLIVLLGDYAAGHRWVTGQVHPEAWAGELGRLAAPLGVHAILGNHDWWDDRTAQRRGHGPVVGQIALERVGIRVYENDAVRFSKAGQPFWLAGLGDQIALMLGRLDPLVAGQLRSFAGAGDVSSGAPINRSVIRALAGNRKFAGVDDLPATLAKITDDAPVILLAHEPDIFAQDPARVSLTLSGHTHGGQVRMFGYSPVVPSRFGNRFAYGHIVENGRHLIVSGGLGNSITPIRFGVPPEIVVIEVGSTPV